MQKPPPDEIQYLEFQNNQEQNLEQDQSPQQAIKRSRKEYFYLKLTLSVILVLMATASAQTQMQYYGPYVRTVQNYFNYHLLQHDSQDLYEGSTVIYYRTQEYFMASDIFEFFRRYAQTMNKLSHDSFFYSLLPKCQSMNSPNQEIVKILIINEVNQKKESNNFEAYINKKLNSNQNTLQSPYRINSFSAASEQSWIIKTPLHQVGQFFNLTVLNKNFYEHKIKKIQLLTNLYIKFKDDQNCSVEVKTICLFSSDMMMAVKVQTNVLDYKEQILLHSENQEFDDKNLGIRKLSQFHNMNFDFKYMSYVLFVVNSVLFCIQFMVIVRTNKKIEQNLSQERQFEKQFNYINYLNKKKLSPIYSPRTFADSPQTQLHDYNKLKQQTDSFLQYMKNEKPPVKKLSYKQRLDIIGIYNIIELLLSFLVLITVQSKGLVCLFCWAKMSVYLSETGNRMMIGFLFKKALPMYLKILVNISIWLTGFVFFSMVTYQNTKKFESIQLSYYQYIFNYFQYGIFENFKPIRKYGDMYAFLYFIQMAFLVMLGNNLLQSILAQQVLKNSNMQDLIEFIEEIEVQCPVCGCPPEIKKKIKLKLTKQNNRQNRFISEYFQAQKQIANKSRYEIKILSPQFSPMFHKSQLTKKQFKLKKRPVNNISIVGQQSLLDSPPLSPISPLMPLSPIGSPYSPYTKRIIQQQRKKVKIEIGGQVQQKDISKIQKFTKKIKSKTQIINKILHSFSVEHSSIDSAVGKRFHIQFLKKKIQEIKHLTAKME